MATMSKLDYLKKYMSSGDGAGETKVKRKKPRMRRKQNIMIIDNDVKFNDDRNKGGSDSDNEFDLEEDKPQVYFDGHNLLSEYNKNKDRDKEGRWAPVDSRGLSPSMGLGRGDENDDRGQKHISSNVQRSKNHEHVRKRHDSLETFKQDGSPDLSPERSRKRSHEHSPRKRQRHDSVDLSPRRKVNTDSSPDLSPPRNRKAPSPSDRQLYKQRQRHDSLESTENEKRHGNVLPNDLLSSRSRRKSSSSDLSPERLEKGRKPPFNNNKLRNSPDFSPKRKQSKDQSPDLSPPRHRSKHLKSDLSQKRIDNKSRNSPDLSPMRQEGQHKTKVRKDPQKWQRVSPEVVKLGKKSGLQSAKSLREENIRHKQLENKHFANMETSLSGRGATTIYRDKSGKKIDLDEEKKKRDEIEKKKAEDGAKYDKWKKGLKQHDEYQKKLEEEWHEMAKPLARYKDDKDLDEMLKQQEREEDPMLSFIKKSREKSKEKKKEKPRYKGSQPPPNRFNLWPGYRWDGVDRSNGFEKKRFAAIAERQSISVDAYKWSVEDM